jgi:hypothetical protein
MLQWHAQDPVSQKEIDRNNSGYAFQGNRNPFVDEPAYANLVWSSSCPGLGALPVTLISFGGRLQGSAVVLQWKVAQEQQLRSYTVQRSLNGRTWTTVAEVNAQGRNLYTLPDEVGSLQGSRVYYRLVMNDVDGKTRLSEIFSLHLPRQLMFTAVPNPARQQLTLQLGSSFRGGQVRLTDYSGRIVLQQALSGSVPQVQLRLGQLAAGTYLVTVTNQQGQQATQRIQVVQ